MPCVGRAFSFWMLNLVVHKVLSGLWRVQQHSLQTGSWDEFHKFFTSAWWRVLSYTTRPLKPQGKSPVLAEWGRAPQPVRTPWKINIPFPTFNWNPLPSRRLCVYNLQNPPHWYPRILRPILILSFIIRQRNLSSVLTLLPNFVCIFRLSMCHIHSSPSINPLNAELNPICHLLVLLGAHHTLHFSRIRVKIPEHKSAKIPSTISSCPLNFVRWLLIFVGPQEGTCFLSTFWCVKVWDDY